MTIFAAVFAALPAFLYDPAVLAGRDHRAGRVSLLWRCDSAEGQLQTLLQ